MNVKQLRCILEVVRCGLSISQAAEKLNTVQPGISTQIKLLEEELGTKIFQRHGRRLVGTTPAGEHIIQVANEIVCRMDDLRHISTDYVNQTSGCFSIATTHTQARYVLPSVISAFTQQFPDVRLTIQQGSPSQICDLVVDGQADIAIATEHITQYTELVTIPLYNWNRCIVAPPEHDIFQYDPVSLEQLAEYPILTYDFSYAGRSLIQKAFSDEKLDPKVILTAMDSDVIKCYVELGLGVGILASMAYDEQKDTSLRFMNADHLFPQSTCFVGLRKGGYIRKFMYKFIEMLSPKLNGDVIKMHFETEKTTA